MVTSGNGRYVEQDCFPVYNGGIPETTSLLEERFDHIFYTGSSQVSFCRMQFLLLSCSALNYVSVREVNARVLIVTFPHNSLMKLCKPTLVDGSAKSVQRRYLCCFH